MKNMQKQINPVVGVIAIVVVLAIVVFAGYKMFLKPVPNEPVDPNPYTKAFNEKMKQAFARKKAGAPGDASQDLPMSVGR